MEHKLTDDLLKDMLNYARADARFDEASTEQRYQELYEAQTALGHALWSSDMSTVRVALKAIQSPRARHSLFSVLLDFLGYGLTDEQFKKWKHENRPGAWGKPDMAEVE